MSDHLPLDKHIKEQLGEYSPDVPPYIWDQLVARREQQRPKGFWLSFGGNKKWLLMAVLLLGLGGAAYWLLNRPSSAIPSNINTEGANTNGTLPANNQPIASNQPNSGSNIITDNTNNNTIQPNAAQSVKPDNFGNGNNNTSTDNNTDNQPNVANNKPSAPTSGVDIAPSAPSRNVNTNRNDKPGSPTVKRTRTNAKPAAADWTDADVATATDTKGQPLQAGQATDAFAGSLKQITGAATPFMADKQVANELQKRLLYSLVLPDCPTIEDNAAGNKKYLELYAGPDFALRSFGSFNNDTNSIAYLQKRKESLTFSSAFSAGLRYTKVFNNGMSLRSGINYSQINEKFLYVNERDIRYILVITPRQITSGGNTITVYDTLRYTETGKRIKTTYNRYRSIDIPLQLGYEFGNGRWHTNISAGAIVNLYSWQKGDMLDSAYQPVSITTGKGSSAYGFKTNIGVGFLGSVSVYYKLTPRMHLLAEPYFRYNLQPMTRDNQNVTQKYSTLGLRLGVRWDFK
jgi:hypothetical protein